MALLHTLDDIFFNGTVSSSIKVELSPIKLLRYLLYNFGLSVCTAQLVVGLLEGFSLIYSSLCMCSESVLSVGVVTFKK